MELKSTVLIVKPSPLKWDAGNHYSSLHLLLVNPTLYLCFIRNSHCVQVVKEKILTSREETDLKQLVLYLSALVSRCHTETESINIKHNLSKLKCWTMCSRFLFVLIICFTVGFVSSTSSFTFLYIYTLCVNEHCSNQCNLWCLVGD